MTAPVDALGALIGRWKTDHGAGGSERAMFEQLGVGEARVAFDDLKI